MVEHVQQRWPQPQELREVLEEFKFGMPCLFEVARRVFEELVDPEACHRDSPCAAEVMQCNMSFSEWALFDFDMGDGMTPILAFAKRDPSIADFVNTQFYSRFWVISQDWSNGQSVLRDSLTCEDFLVHDKDLAKCTRWSTGTLGARIARVNGQWRFAGQIHFHDNAPAEAKPHDPSAGGLGIQDPRTFITHAQQVIGHRGIYRESVTEQFMLDMCDIL